MKRASAPAQMPRPATRSGYTLIELLIVVALLGLAGSLVIPYLVGRTSLETQAVVRLIIADLSFAQSDALAHQEYRRVQFFEDGSGYCIIRVPENFDEPFDPETADYIIDPFYQFHSGGLYIVNFETDKRFHGVSIANVNVDGGNNFITYDELGGTVMSPGTIPGSGGSLQVTSDEATYEIHISPFTGKLTVEKVD